MNCTNYCTVYIIIILIVYKHDTLLKNHTKNLMENTSFTLKVLTVLQPYTSYMAMTTTGYLMHCTMHNI